MELKVWVDGIQRVVCGVTEASTCQDVVYALAHATGQTGRFTLLERWRGSERLLAPADRPLRVLAKWGEYAGDVHFLMRRSDAATSSSASSNANNHKSRFAPAKQAVKKSLTFSGGGGGGSGDEDRPKGVVRGRPRHPPPYDEAVSRSSGRFPTSQQQLSLPPPSDPLPKQQQPQEGQDSPKSPELKKLPLPAEEEKEGNEEVEVVAARDPQYQDLLRLVSLQREKLDNQQSELSQFDAEILYWENRLQEQEEKLSILQEEVCHLERTQHEQEGELIQLDRRSFSEEVDLGRQEERTLRSELTLARSQLANCETELLQCRQRIRLLLEEMAEERRLRTELERKEREEQERSLQAQLDCIQQQLKEKMVEADSQKAVAEQAKEEMHDLELKLEDKEKEIGKLMADIREANLRSLSLMPSEEGKLVLEGNFHNRPGSTRKIIGSPRQLENAVPTNKNPHGVWV